LFPIVVVIVVFVACHAAQLLITDY